MYKPAQLQCKRPPSYVNQLSVLDFRKRKAKVVKPVPSSKLVIVQTPTPTASETLGSTETSPREEVPVLDWDADEFTPEMINKCADLLLGAAEEAWGDEPWDLSDDDDDDATMEDVEVRLNWRSPLMSHPIPTEESEVEDESIITVAAEAEDGVSDVPVMRRPISPVASKDDDETEDDEWRPIGKPKQKKVIKEENKPRARRRPDFAAQQKRVLQKYGVRKGVMNTPATSPDRPAIVSNGKQGHPPGSVEKPKRGGKRVKLT